MPSSPEIKVQFSAVGRETLDAIAEELSPFPNERRYRPPAESGPEIVLSEAPAGRETLAAIEAELSSPRDSLPTLPYGDRVPNGSGATTPSKWPPRLKTRRGRSSRPPAVKRTPIPALPQVAVTSRPEIYELLTFVLKHVPRSAVATNEQRLQFIERYLLQRLPARSMSGISKTDVTPGTERGSLVLRVWYVVDFGPR